MTSKRIAILIRVALVGTLLYVLAAGTPQIREALTHRDFVQYWAAAKLLLHRTNPYDPDAEIQLQRSQGLPGTKALIIRLPPWSLPMMLPLGVVGFYPAWVLWMTLLVAALLTSIRLCWRMFSRDDTRWLRSRVFLAGYVFAPVLACLVAGQIGLFLLLGVVLFLHFEKSRPLLAGFALLLPLAKPHLLVLFWCVLACWMLVERRWRILAGLLAALTVATGVAVALDPGVFAHYSAHALSNAAIQTEFIPALAGVLRLLFLRQAFWAQFIPLAIGLIWSVWFYAVNRQRWNWRDHGMAVMVVSVLTTPYGWLTDEVILMPVILQAAIFVMANGQRNRLWPIILFAGLNGLLLMMIVFQVPFASGMYFWSSVVWFGWYYYGRTRRAQRETRSSVADITPLRAG